MTGTLSRTEADRRFRETMQADSEQRFRNLVDRLVGMPSDAARASFLALVAKHHSPDLVQRLRRATWDRLRA